MKKFRQILAMALAFAMCFTFTAADMATVTAAPVEGLKIVAGSNGTLLQTDEQLASVTLKNTSDADVTINVYELGKYSEVTIAAGEEATISAPDIWAASGDASGDAYKLALVADGAEVPLEGEVSGEVTVCIVKGVLDYYVSHGQETPRWITCAVYADDTGVNPEYSVLPMAEGVSAGDNNIDSVSIVSNAANTAAIRVGGNAVLNVKNTNIELYGDGGDDFTGIGAALGAADNGTLNVESTDVYTAGIIRCALFAGDNGTLNLAECKVQCEPGEYQSSVSIPSAGMASPPNGLGIWGNCRAMNLVDCGTITIDSSEIISQNWGVLGVDDVTDGHLTVTDSHIVIEEQGYGSYTIGKCVDTFSGCTFDINYGVIGYAAAGDGGELHLIDGSVANSPQYYGFVTHQSFNGTNTIIEVSGQGTELNTGLGGIIAKGRGSDITISDGAVVTATSGVLVRAQINDDTGAGSMDGTEVVNVTVASTELTGDIVQGMGQATDASGNATKKISTMNVALDGATLNGNISSAFLTLAIDDGKISMDNITDVGVVTDTEYGFNEGATLNVTLDGGATWNTAGTSYLMSLTVNDGTINGHVYVDGEEVTVANGDTYSGYVIVSSEEVDAASLTPAASKGGLSTPVIIIIVIVIIAAIVVVCLVSSKKKAPAEAEAEAPEKEAEAPAEEAETSEEEAEAPAEEKKEE